MARKSNKTAHVLNLLSGHEEDQQTSETSVTAQAQEAARPSAKPELPVQNVSVIDTTEEDPLTELIQNKLSDGLEQEDPSQEGSPQTEASPETAVQEDAPQTEAQEDVPQTEIQEDVPQTAVQEDTSQTETTPEPEPDFVRLNIMERIVQEKIIYFMRQFDVCTCDRCVADVVALTLNGLAPKYIVVDRAAAAPLSDFYTNKFIADVTVEAMKACATIKENPRH